jgi:hypothetical protein
MVVVAQLVRALDCGSRGRGFKSRLPPSKGYLFFAGNLFYILKRANNVRPIHFVLLIFEYTFPHSLILPASKLQTKIKKGQLFLFQNALWN